MEIITRNSERRLSYGEDRLAAPGRHSRPLNSAPDRHASRPASATSAQPHQPGDVGLPVAGSIEALWAIAAAIDRLADAVVATGRRLVSVLHCDCVHGRGMAGPALAARAGSEIRRQFLGGVHQARRRRKRLAIALCPVNVPKRKQRGVTPRVQREIRRFPTPGPPESAPVEAAAEGSERHSHRTGNSARCRRTRDEGDSRPEMA